MSSLKPYLAIFFALVVLTLATTGIAFIDLGAGWNATVALAIAAGKASLVALYFMHLRNSSPLTRLFAVAGIFWIGILIALTVSDYLTRS
jgi:cytochrome c oxidase subunit IV